jgi:hypothetical protein
MTITHVDRTGTPWTFEIDCTPIQGRMVERLLSFVHCIGNREEITLSYLADWEQNTAFRDTLEHVVLSALREWTAPPQQPPTPARVSETVNVNASTVNTNTEPVEEREPFYWENF